MLLHDAPEYVIGDMISPFKAVIGDAYKTVERRLLAAIHRRFGLPAKSPPELEKLIKTADRQAAFLEATRLAGFDITEARRFFGRPPLVSTSLERDYLKPWPAERPRRAISSDSPSFLSKASKAGPANSGLFSLSLATLVPRGTMTSSAVAFWVFGGA